MNCGPESFTSWLGSDRDGSTAQRCASATTGAKRRARPEHCTQARMSLPSSLQPPKLKRQLRSPKTYFVLAAFTVGPILALSGALSHRAERAALHVLLAFGVLLLVFRIMGKRELSRLSPFELVTLMLVPEIVSEVVQGNGELTSALVGLSTLFLLVLSFSIASHRFEFVQNLMESPPTLLVAGGKMIEQNMNAERIAPDELIAEMHKQGIGSITELRWAILEGSGNITCIPHSSATRSPTVKPDDPDP